MSRDVSGVYTKVGASVAVTATTIASTPYNNQIDDLANAVNDTVLLSGVKPFTGPQSMGSQKLTSLASGTAATDAGNVSQIQSGVVSKASAVAGTVDVITITMSPASVAWVNKETFEWVSGGANTVTTPTINKDGLGAKTIVSADGTALAVGATGISGVLNRGYYDGTNVRLLGLSGVALLASANVYTAPQTIRSVDAGAFGGPVLSLDRNSASPANLNTLGVIEFHGRSSTGVDRIYAKMFSWINSQANAAEEGRLSLHTIYGGTVTERLILGRGLYTPNATGNDKGPDTINASSYYKDGTLLAVPVTIRKATADVRSSVTLTNDSDFTFSMLANTNYLIKFRYYISIIGAPAGVKIGLSGPAAPTSTLFTSGMIANSDTTNTYFNTAVTTSSSGNIAYTQTGSATSSVVVEGEVLWRNGANAGTFVLQTARQSAGGNTTFNLDSSFTYVTF